MRTKKGRQAKRRKLRSPKASDSDSSQNNSKTDEVNVDKKPYIGSIEQAPKFTSDNQYVKEGYRINFDKTWYIVKSLFMIHNETANVWTHLLGAMIFVGLFISTFYVGPLHPTTHDAIQQELNKL